MGVQEVQRTPPSKDAGIDVRGVLVLENSIRIKIAVQVKRYTANVTSPDIQKLRGSLSQGEVGWFVSTSDYSSGAQAEAEAPGRQPISLLTGLKVAELLLKYHVTL